jgi:hypothetical protein
MCPESMTFTLKLEPGTNVAEAERKLLDTLEDYGLSDKTNHDGWQADVVVREPEGVIVVRFNDRFFNYGMGVSFSAMKRAASAVEGVSGFASVVVTDGDGIDWVPANLRDS